MKVNKVGLIEAVLGFGFWVLFALYSAFHWGMPK